MSATASGPRPSSGHEQGAPRSPCCSRSPAQRTTPTTAAQTGRASLPVPEVPPAALPAGRVRVDCHVHTVTSGDSVLQVEQLAARAVELGLDVVFVTDHNEVSAALRAQGRDLGVRIEVGEEVRTADGELLGLFLTERIPYVLPIREVVRRIRGQGGLVGLPHPFDPLRAGAGAVADALCADGAVDLVETFNAKVHDAAHNDAAAALASRHGLPATAGSDAHDVTGLGAAYLEMPDFDGPREFLTALAQARIVGELRAHAPRFARRSGTSTRSPGRR